MSKAREMLYEGKAKKLFAGPDLTSLIQHFKDDITAYNAEKKNTLHNKGIVNNRISYLLMKYLEGNGISTHILKFLGDREQLVKKVDIIPVEVVVRNISAGGFCKKFGIHSGETISPSVVEFYYKSDALSDPMMTEDHLVSFKLATRDEISNLKEISLKVNKLLSRILKQVNIILVDFKLEFGRIPNTRTIILSDEISPDTCRLWDSANNFEILDKDRYRLCLGDVLYGYNQVLLRLLSVLSG